MQQHKIILFVILISAIFITTANAENLISEKLLSQASLSSVWQSKLAIQENEKITKMWLIDNYLYILTDKNYMFCLDGKTGQTAISFQAATEKLPVLKPAVYKNTVYIIAGNELTVIDVKNMGQLYHGKIKYPVVAAPAVNSSHLYVPGTNQRLRAFGLRGQMEKFAVSPDNSSNVNSVMATNKHVIFTTSKGNIISITPNSPKRFWQYDAVGAIDTPVIEKANFIYASSRDTNLYKINAATGSLEWKFYCGSELDTSATVTEKFIYQYAIGKGLYAIDKENGKSKWLLPTGIALLSEHNDKAYVVDKTGICVVMNNKTGEKEKAINFFKVIGHSSNADDSRMFIMNGKDTIACIKPAK